MTEKIGLEAFFDTSKFKQGFAEYVAAMDKAVFGTNKLTDTMEATNVPSTKLANSITDVGNRVLLQTRQLDIYQKELGALQNSFSQTAVKIGTTRESITRLGSLIGQQQGLLAQYKGELTDVTAKYGASSDAARQKAQLIGFLTEAINKNVAALAREKAELEKLSADFGKSSAQAQKKQLQIDRLSVSLDKNMRTLGGYRKELDASRGGLQQVEQEAKETQTALSRLDVTIGSFAGNTLSNAFQSAASGAKDLLIGIGQEAFNAVASHERLTLAIETLTARELLNTGQADDMATALRNASGRSQELLGWIEQLAVKTPFSQDDISASFRLAQAYGFTSEEAQRLTQVMVDFTAGTGQTGDVTQRLALALGQISAKGKVSAEELNQLRETGLNVNTILSEMGFTLNDVEKGFVKADNFIEAVVQTLEQDFAGAAERQSESWSGLLNTLEDTKKIALREFFQGTFDAIQPLAQTFVDTLGSEEFRANLREAGQELGNLVAQGVKLTQETDWDVISRASKQAAEDAKPLKEIFNPKEALEAAARGYLVASGGLAALNELARTGEVVEYLQGSGSAAEKLRAIVNDLNKEFDKLDRRPEGPRGQGDSIGKLNAPSEAIGPTTQELEAQITTLGKLNDAAEDYGEKQADINKAISKASQDYAEKELALQGDLKEAYSDLYTGRQEAAAELYDGLLKAESEFNQVASEVAKERLALDQELNASRLSADAEFNGERAQLAQEFNQEVAEIGRARLDAETALNEGRAEAQAEFLDSLAELEREHGEEIVDINRSLSREFEDFNRERLQAEEDFNRERTELERDHARDVKDITKDILDAERDSANKRFDIEDDLQERLDKLNDKYKQKSADLQDEIADIVKNNPVRGLAAEKSLSKEDQKRLADLRKELERETAEFDKQQADLEEKAQQALDKEAERSAESLSNLQQKLADENLAYTEAIAEQDRKYAQQEADRNLAHDRAVEDLTLRLDRENEAYARQQGDIQKQLDDSLSDLQRTYDAAIVKLDERLAVERIKHDAQRAALQAGYEQELVDIQVKHDEALGKLQARLDQEAIKYQDQRVKLQKANQEELADLDANYNQRVVTVRQKLEDIAVANAEKQLELQAQMAETTADFEEKIAAIGKAWSGEAMDATTQYAEYLAKFQSYLAQTKFPINFEVNLPEFLIPGSPSPLEESLTRTEGLIQRLNSTSISGPSLSMPTMQTPAMLPPMIRGGDTTFANSFGDVVLPGPLNSPQDARNLARTGAGQIEGMLVDTLMAAATRQRGSFRKNPGVRT